ncbi:hypothetical protein C4J81_11080 [Deltaproteobacteria bacterium Smac51]|nr:hypothetical protein C4J81_11080 [Deltaproteobacteria bacterium Smac51]
MIIKVRQTKANISHKFRIYYDNKRKFDGTQTGYARCPSCWLYNLDESLYLEGRGKRKGLLRAKILNLIFCIGALITWLSFISVPIVILYVALFFFIATRFPTVSDLCIILDDTGKKVASFTRHVKGLTGYHLIRIGDEEYRAYSLSRSHYQYISVYSGDTQIAQINKDLHTVNNRDIYILYLLDDQEAMADFLSMFVLYFDNHEHGNFGEVFVGTKKNWHWTWSKTDHFYDENWLPSHFDVDMDDWDDSEE